MGFQEKIDLLSRTESVDEKVEIKFLLHKGIALGFSPCFFPFFFTSDLSETRKTRDNDKFVDWINRLSCLLWFGLSNRKSSGRITFWVFGMVGT